VNTKYRYLRLTDAEIVAFSKKSIPYWDFNIFCSVELDYQSPVLDFVYFMIITYVVSLLCSVWR
jgi:hypothetical protein